MPAYQLLSTLEEKTRPDNAALLVVDVMNDFCSPDGWWNRTGTHKGISMVEKMMPNLLRFIDEAQKAGILIVYIQAIYDEQFLSMPFKEHLIHQLHAEAPCQSGTWGAQFYQVKPREVDIIVQKHRYSAFAGTELDVILRSKKIQTLIITGVATNVCVGTTAYDGFFLDYYIVVPDDCTASFDEEQQKAAIWTINRSYGVVTKSEDIIAAWHQTGS
ncbi:cysteine hydrolase family protein [Chloroflexota bacterium]